MRDSSLREQVFDVLVPLLVAEWERLPGRQRRDLRRQCLGRGHGRVADEDRQGWLA